MKTFTGQATLTDEQVTAFATLKGWRPVESDPESSGPVVDADGKRAEDFVSLFVKNILIGALAEPVINEINAQYEGSKVAAVTQVRDQLSQNVEVSVE